MTEDEIAKRARELYSDGPFGQLMCMTHAGARIVRHDDEILGGSGYWIDVSVFVPDMKKDA
jgi:hypothetical protein